MMKRALLEVGGGVGNGCNSCAELEAGVFGRLAELTLKDVMTEF
jgi:hypothetical protein